jgi:polar amino acid transport system substrate-binding protein
MCAPTQSIAQDPEIQYEELIVATITRPPFSMVIDGVDSGYSIALWEELAADLDLRYRYVRFDTFPAMISAVENGEADAAIANISITLEREQRLDFTQPFFDAGVQIMLADGQGGTWALIKAFISPRLLLAVFGAFALLVGIGMLMWVFERRKQDMFGMTAKEAMFPAFWWALNLVISGGYEEKMPVSGLGRVFGSLMVVASLFVVSIFVANITSTMTLNALNTDVDSIHDLDGRRVGTTMGSTTSTLLDEAGVTHTGYVDLVALQTAFETGEIEAIVFDGPILAYYARTTAPANAVLIDRVFRPENYGIALPTGSLLREPLNRSLLRAREAGKFQELRITWFGAAYSNR